ncbi:MAG: nucleoside transporter C-terminal domain-containing protein [Syntrophaceae bacterium]|nr:nucleoside transporter C-terminal domain-containing protein [Syntrophaceae bacterium]
MLSQLTPLLGIIFIFVLSAFLSSDRKRINWILVCWGIGLQFSFAILILKTYPEVFFEKARSIFEGITFYASQGSRFLFGSLVDQKDFTILSMGSVIIFVSAMMGVLNYIKILPMITVFMARIMKKAMKTSGAETLAASMSIFMGIEAISGLKNYIGRMTHSELFSVMTCFMATIAGSVMAVYVGVFGANPGYILAASFMNAPAALVLSKILIPETDIPETSGSVKLKDISSQDHGLIEALSNSALDGMKLTLSVGAMLLAFVAVIHLSNSALGLLGTSFDHIGSLAFAPVAFLIGIPWNDCMVAGKLIAIKTVFNEWIAYSQMKELVASGQLQSRSTMILTFALCSFANFGSLGILIGGISSLAPERRSEVASLGMKSILAGLLSSLLTACVAGLIMTS